MSDHSREPAHSQSSHAKTSRTSGTGTHQAPDRRVPSTGRRFPVLPATIGIVACILVIWGLSSLVSSCSSQSSTDSAVDTSVAEVSDVTEAAATTEEPATTEATTEPETVALADQELSDDLDSDEWLQVLNAKAWADATDTISEGELATADASRIDVEGADTDAATDSLQRLAYETKQIADKGYTIGFELVDISTGATISYNADATVYSASSIKGPYLLYLEQEVLGEDQNGLRTTIENCIVNSDNNAYRTLHSTFGESGFSSWMAEQGVSSEAVSTLAAYYYTDYSAADLCGVWKNNYDFLKGGSTSQARYLTELFSEVVKSPIHAAMLNSATTWSKAGWYPDEDDLASMCDGGIVCAQSGDYAVAIVSDDPEDFEGIATIAVCLDQAHTALLS